MHVGRVLFGHITAAGTVPAVLSNVQSTDLSTSLKRDGLLARTIEHLMAVFHVYGLTNVLVKISRGSAHHGRLCPGVLQARGERRNHSSRRPIGNPYFRAAGIAVEP